MELGGALACLLRRLALRLALVLGAAHPVGRSLQLEHEVISAVAPVDELLVDGLELGARLEQQPEAGTRCGRCAEWSRDEILIMRHVMTSAPLASS